MIWDLGVPHDSGNLHICHGKSEHFGEQLEIPWFIMRCVPVFFCPLGSTPQLQRHPYIQRAWDAERPALN